MKTLEYIVGKDESQSQKPASPPQQKPNYQPVQEEIASIFINDTQKKLDELDLAFLRSLVSYFEEIADKIRRYHKDHHASQGQG